MFPSLSLTAPKGRPQTGRNAMSSFLKALPIALGVFAIGSSLCPSAHAQALTNAGTSIDNQASITYTDESGANQSANSNSISTIVQRVTGVQLVSDNTKNAIGLARVNFPHTITNTGNANDTFNLTAPNQTGDGFDLTRSTLDLLNGPGIYADANGDGVADNLAAPITVTPQLAPGQSFSFVVSGTLPLLASGNAKVTVTATSQFDSGITDSNLDTVNASSRANITVVKSINNSSGVPGAGPFTYSLDYSNSGSTAGTNLSLTDTLPLGISYVPSSARWSGSATPLTDAIGGDPAGVSFSYSSLLRTLSANINSVPASGTGKITFQVTIDNNILPQIIKNSALYTYNDGSLLLENNLTNVVDLTALQLSILTFTGDIAALAPQGSTVSFANTLVNIGTGTDTFNVAVGTNNFPAGTTFKLYKSDGITLLADTNSDGKPDTGPVAPLIGSYVVILKATLPPKANVGGPFSVQKTATSVFDPTKTATATDVLTAILPGSVDLTNGGLLGVGQGPELTPVTNLIADLLASGTTNKSFDLYIKNGSASTDNFDLSASASTNFSPVTAFPAGVVVTFKSDAGAVITNTGDIAPGATVHVTAEVALPSGLAPQALKFYFRTLSSVTDVVDTKLDGITVNIPGRSLTLTPNNTGNVFRNGSIVYTHTLTNNGTLAEGGVSSNIALAAANAASGFTTVIYRDINGDNLFDAGDAVVTGNLPVILPTQSITLFVKVTAPAAAAVGASNVTTLTATTTGGLLGTPPTAVSATDTTTILSSVLTFVKTQALDANNDGAPDTAYSATTLTTGALPGKTIRYRIVVSNTGTAPISNAVVTDAIPAHTVYDTGDGVAAGDGTPDAASWYDGTTRHASTNPPANGATGTLTFNIGTIAPGQSITITFGAKIQ